MKNKESWKQVGSRIRNLRKSSGLTLHQLSQGCNISSNAISLVERGAVAPTIATLCKIANALGVSPSSLFEEICPTEVILSRVRDGRSIRFTDENHLPTFDPMDDNGCYTRSKGNSKNLRPNQTMLCVSGKVMVDLDDRTISIEPGDRLDFCSGTAKRWWNRGEEACVLILVVPPSLEKKDPE